MADVVIRGIELPKGDLEYVSLWVYGDGRVYVSNNASAAHSRRLPDLAVPLPEGHGDLIDRDNVLLDIDCTGTNRFGMLDEDIRAFLRRYEPIVPAEGGGEE